MKPQTKIALLALVAGIAAAAPASATDVRFRVSANVASSCEMNFKADVHALSGSAFSLGTLDQFCNVPFQMRLMHSAAVDRVVLSYRGRNVPVNFSGAIVEPHGRPVNGSTLLTAHGITAAQADELASTAVLLVTPSSF